ncbi:MAG: phosphoglycerate mutase (2,3-diphosphoglycerate-independent) [Candidatus Kerfeldbacteria bacterium RIFCSPLOWO2_01_FULL_48_11]|uniref:2,3-bisphosphoglycerate-independent phosphoglycerate mutase n=1 Tax=Candidatus Kerfeldbacteria bacterium RIFCSPLOWO2_01_FULL_48_11 TaxID=1798543 RepID=A0A1G2B516_9BACT|nr:MAG: 2,3-bisphosphoglycerate-independent phosphoglycerate mutase [Parcubacteria group bacterium GW2011_GWA2_48_9]OGY84278.1 MAG: phosphoglycerate mutase (2,3-diphosphoglycerate-independent) [Candidatus Kerfeldbacteria bacterium RIFCSPLOWO2_01_FULL_48_11]HCM68629.1 2,3-bisphosphoglycerate-independent phosphoglycerate mutase [Candidatus Kerfeldbacteria bacterium]
MAQTAKPVVLAILDGWGIAPPSKGNAIFSSATPAMDDFLQNFPTMAVQASGEAVGLTWGEMGNSEVGHLNLGAGRIVYQSLPRINKAISDDSFFSVPAFLAAIAHVKKHGSRLHLLGLCSNGGIHSSLDHLFALLELAKKKDVQDVYIHAILDGRDSPRDSAANFIEKIESKIKENGVGEIASLSGRYYAMDRDNRWDRIEQAYLAMTEGIGGRTAGSPVEAIQQSYEKANYDEEFVPTVITKDGKPVGTVDNGDAIIFFNFRPDRARELTKAFALPSFDRFQRKKTLKKLFFVTMTQYDRDLPVKEAFSPGLVTKPIAKVISDAGLNQLHIAETEKYAHVTYFFNGGLEEPFPNQDNVLIPSPKVSSYAEKPEMSAKEITDKLLEEIEKDQYHFMVINFANADMVGHTGNLKATSVAVQIVDECMGRIVKAVLPLGGVVVITADHGNAESKINLQTSQMDKEHTVNPVPVYIVGEQFRGVTPYKDLAQDNDLSMLPVVGILADVPVTILQIMNLPVPNEMTGRNLLT